MWTNKSEPSHRTIDEKKSIQRIFFSSFSTEACVYLLFETIWLRCNDWVRCTIHTKQFADDDNHSITDRCCFWVSVAPPCWMCASFFLSSCLTADKIVQRCANGNVRLTEALLYGVIRFKHSFAIENASGTYVIWWCLVNFFQKYHKLPSDTTKIFTKFCRKLTIVLELIEEQYRFSFIWPMI